MNDVFEMHNATKNNQSYLNLLFRFMEICKQKKRYKKVLRRNMEEDKNQVIYFHSVFDVGQIFCI